MQQYVLQTRCCLIRPNFSEPPSAKLDKFYCTYLTWTKSNEYLYWKINEKKLWWKEREENIPGHDYKNAKLDLLFQFFLGVSKCTVSSPWTAAFLGQISTHACFVADIDISCVVHLLWPIALNKVHQSFHHRFHCFHHSFQVFPRWRWCIYQAIKELNILLSSLTCISISQTFLISKLFH